MASSETRIFDAGRQLFMADHRLHVGPKCFGIECLAGHAMFQDTPSSAKDAVVSDLSFARILFNTAGCKNGVEGVDTVSRTIKIENIAIPRGNLGESVNLSITEIMVFTVQK